jgi:hypothetical protein
MFNVVSSFGIKTFFLVALLDPRTEDVCIGEDVRGFSSSLLTGLRDSLDEERLPASREEDRRLVESLDAERFVGIEQFRWGSLEVVAAILPFGPRDEDLVEIRLVGSLDDVLLVGGSPDVALLETK